MIPTLIVTTFYSLKEFESLCFANFETYIITSSCRISWSSASFSQVHQKDLTLIMLCPYNTCSKWWSLMELSSWHYRTMKNKLSRSITLVDCKYLLYTSENQNADHRGMKLYWWHFVKSPWTSLSFGWLYDISSEASRICSILLDSAELIVISVSSERMLALDKRALRKTQLFVWKTHLLAFDISMFVVKNERITSRKRNAVRCNDDTFYRFEHN